MDRYQEMVARALADTRLPDELSPEEWERIKLQVNRARWQLVLHFSFFGSILSQLLARTIYVKDPDQMPVRTLATDGRNLYIWPPFALHITADPVMMGLLLHELFHVILLHHARTRPFHIKELANIAMDYAINLLVNQAACKVHGHHLDAVRNHAETLPWIVPPGIFFYDEQFAGMTWEEIYDKLFQQVPGVMAGTGQGNGQGRLVDSHELWGQGQDDADARQEAQRVGDALRQARMLGLDKQQGSLPGELKRLIDAWIDPPLPWTQLLQRFLVLRPADYGWAPGDLRFADPMPWPEDQPKVDDIVLAIDTSGSMDDRDVAVAISQCQSILHAFPGTRGWLTLCDAAVHKFTSLEEPLTLERVGYGGTDFRPLFRFMHKLKTDPAFALQHGARQFNARAVVYFTDGYGTFPDPDREEDHVDCDVIWVMTTSQEPPKHPRYAVTRIDPARAVKV